MEPAPVSQSKVQRPPAGGKAPLVSFVLAMAAGGLLRIWMFHHFFEANGDTLVYGDIAKNLLLHGRYAISVNPGILHTTLIRLPGYPLFLAACFKLFGMENYAAPVWVQIALGLGTCLVLAAFARRIAPPALKTGAAHGTLWLAAMCPFTAIYEATPLTEGPTFFVLALAMWGAARFRERQDWGSALGFTFAVTYAALLRPDGALAGLALAPAMLVALRDGSSRSLAARMRIALVCLLLAAAPFAAWTWRNWRAFHVIQPLVPESAADPGQFVNSGWERWVRTWCLDFVSTYDIYWNVPGGDLDINQLPSRAFDSPAQRAETAALADEYNDGGDDFTPRIDAEFAQLAEQRIAAHPLRFYLWLPLGRVTDMWLRPRVENMNIDLDWWVYAHHNQETEISWTLAALNALYLLLGIAGLCLRPRMGTWLLAYMALRSAMLFFTVGAPEARYTLECFPMLFALGGVALSRVWRRVASRRVAVRI